jgi:hypothetical protein
MRWSSLLVPAAVALATLSGCQPPTQITLELSTDIPCNGTFGGASIFVGSKGEVEDQPATTTTTACNAGTGRIGSLVVVPSAGSDSEVAIKVVGGRNWSPDRCGMGDALPAAGDGCVVARRILRFVPQTPLELPIALRDSCVGVECPADQTCANGLCVSAEVAAPETCGEPGACDDSALFPQASGDPVVDVAAGYQTTCALTANHRIWCWGDNHNGAFGNSDAPSGPAAVARGMTSSLSAPVSVDLNSVVGCALDTGGAVYCAGRGDLLGDDTGEHSTTPVPVAGLDSGVAQISVSGGGRGSETSCARLDDGGVRCWGYGDVGQLGDGQSGGGYFVPHPVEVQGVSSAVDIAVWARGCAVLSTGAAHCWGGSPGGPGSPGLVEGLTHAAEVSVDYDSNGCARNIDGTMSCWSYPEELASPEAAIGGATDLSLGYQVGCAVLHTGKAMCWGDNTVHGALGIGNTDPRDGPVEVVGLSDARRIAVGTYHVCAVRQNGRVVCWGNNEVGQVTGDGIGAAAPVTLPVDVTIPEP